MDPTTYQKRKTKKNHEYEKTNKKNPVHEHAAAASAAVMLTI
jgi:hypothetical protein